MFTYVTYIILIMAKKADMCLWEINVLHEALSLLLHDPVTLHGPHLRQWHILA